MPYAPKATNTNTNQNRGHFKGKAIMIEDNRQGTTYAEMLRKIKEEITDENTIKDIKELYELLEELRKIRNEVNNIPVDIVLVPTKTITMKKEEGAVTLSNQYVQLLNSEETMMYYASKEGLPLSDTAEKSMWSRKGLTPEQALAYLDELGGLSKSNFEHEGESTSDSETEAYSRVLRKSSESNSTSEIQASDTTLENSLSVASCSYKTSENITVDEQLFWTKVRCRFAQYMSNKPDKFGIKFWIAVDAKSKYVLNAFPYLGKDETRPQDQVLSENVVLRLLEPFTKKGRNVTTDNFFTSVKLAKKLEKLNTTIVGTMNRSRKEVPELVKSSRGDLYETVLLKTDNDNCILTVYQAKPNKNVLLLSTLHTSVTINTNEKKKKPKTVLYYNDTKYGVDVADQMARKYTVKASSRR
ncbi:hypothetical protein ILUMI_26526 [Ignelater luminosus]|uniref:PiggyBac transposable element-derived protein domain-containing protein n=1 Tax=Ignelater luminosus TaxID=2038154 RepID=A0A8K0FZ15_IGNLU|nr:hypothetical protein ILUMI_26526 [Ignelater luminosus]